jgi:hypothetical protein
MQLLSQPQTPDLMPVAFVAQGDDQKFITFEGATLEEMLDRGKQQLANGNYDAWALAYEGFVVVENQRRSAVFVHSWMRGLDRPIVIAQAWGRAEEGGEAQYLGPAVFLPQASAPKGGQRINVIPAHLDERQLRALAAGIEQYAELSKTLRTEVH